ncbi:MAG: flagellar hook-basal body complex protein FliE [Spirochaetales bacterium]|nr:flagellar hook-basal body complex protein FliE [Spirochaetales bacterium]
MTLFEPSAAMGNAIRIERTHPDHLPGKYEPLPDPLERTGFRDALIDSLEETNGLQIAHEELSIRAIMDPESVEAHDLTIAAAKASTSLSITRNVVDRVIQAYRDITNLR